MKMLKDMWPNFLGKTTIEAVRFYIFNLFTDCL